MARARNHRKKHRGRQVIKKTWDIAKRGNLWPSTFRESFDLGPIHLLEQADDEGREWDIVVIETGFSKNTGPGGVPRHYSEECLRAAAPLFEGVPVNAFKFSGQHFDHLPAAVKQAVPGGFVRNEIGRLTNPRFVEALPGGGSGIVARLVLHETEDAEDIRHILHTCHTKNVQGPGFSIDAQGEARNTTVDGRKAQSIIAIESVDSLDLVSNPAAGGRLLRLVASCGGHPNMLRVLDFIRQNMPHWCEGVSTENIEEAKVGELVADILGTTRERTLASLGKSENGSAEFTEAAHVLAGLQQLMELLAAGEMEQALELLAMLIEDQAEEEAEVEPEAPAAPEQTQEAGHTDEDQERRKKKKREEEQMSEATEKRISKLENDLAESLARSRLTEALSASDLPPHAADQIRERYKGRLDFTAAEIRESIKKEKAYLARITESGNVRGCGAGRPDQTVEVGKEQLDRYKDAMYGMLMGETRHNGTRCFTGFLESYRQISGESLSRGATANRVMCGMAYALPNRPSNADEEVEEVHAEHFYRLREAVNGASLRESVLTTTVWTEVFGDSVTRSLIQGYGGTGLPNWQEVVSRRRVVEDFRTQRRIRTGGFADLSTVGELGTYTEFVTPADEEVTFAVIKRGNLWPISMEAIRNDDLDAIQPQRLGIAANRTLAKFVLNTLISDNPLVFDGVALLAVGHSNFQSVALTEASLQTAIQQQRKQTELSSGERLGLMPKILMVPPDLEDTAWELTMSDKKPNTTEDSTIPNITKSKYGVIPLTNIYQTDTDDWQLISDPRLNPTIEIDFLDGETPELFVQDQPTLGSVFTADKITWKIRFIFGGEVLDFRTFSGAVV